MVPFQNCVRQRRPVSTVTKKIEISSNGQNCFILNQNVPKFQLYKHNVERVRIMGFFYELWTFADFDQLCKLGINKQKII